MSFHRYVTASGEHRWTAETGGRPLADGARGHGSRASADQEALLVLQTLLAADLLGSHAAVSEYLARRCPPSAPYGRPPTPGRPPVG